MIEFLAANWLWIVFVIAMFAMHRLGGCGGHSHGHGGGHDQHSAHDSQPDTTDRPSRRPNDTRRVP